jgi:hypothetical protein
MTVLTLRTSFERFAQNERHQSSAPRGVICGFGHERRRRNDGNIRLNLAGLRCLVAGFQNFASEDGSVEAVIKPIGQRRRSWRPEYSGSLSSADHQ